MVFAAHITQPNPAVEDTFTPPTDWLLLGNQTHTYTYIYIYICLMYVMILATSGNALATSSDALVTSFGSID